MQSIAGWQFRLLTAIVTSGRSRSRPGPRPRPSTCAQTHGVSAPLRLSRRATRATHPAKTGSPRGAQRGREARRKVRGRVCGVWVCVYNWECGCGCAGVNSRRGAAEVPQTSCGRSISKVEQLRTRLSCKVICTLCSYRSLGVLSLVKCIALAQRHVLLLTQMYQLSEEHIEFVRSYTRYYNNCGRYTADAALCCTGNVVFIGVLFGTICYDYMRYDHFPKAHALMSECKVNTCAHHCTRHYARSLLYILPRRNGSSALITECVCNEARMLASRIYIGYNTTSPQVLHFTFVVYAPNHRSHCARYHSHSYK